MEEEARDLRKQNILRSLLVEKLIRDQQPNRMLRSWVVGQAGLELPGEQFFLLRSEFLDGADGQGETSGGGNRALSYDELLEETEQLFLERLNGPGLTAYGCVMNEELFFLICLGQPVDPEDQAQVYQAEERIRACCMEAQGELWERLGLGLQLWGSELILGVEQLHIEYEHISKEDFSQLTAKPIMFPRDMAPYIVAPSGHTNALMQSLERQVVRSAMEKDWESCCQAFAQLIEIEADHYPACTHIRDRAAERLTSVFAVAGIPMNNLTLPALNAHLWRKNLRAALSREDVWAVVQEVLANCREYSQPSGPPVSARVSEIVAFVEDHLFEPGLCADMICARFNISPSYLSRIFKERQDIKLIDYIHSRRVEASKPLLLACHPVLNIEQVARQVGYTSVLTYARAFKRMEGMPPGAYRKIHGKTEG